MNTGSTSGTAIFARRVAGTLGVRVLIIAGSFLSGVIVARWLGSAGVGIWASLNVIILLAITIGGFGIQSTITMLVARNRSVARSVLSRSLAFGLTAGAAVAASIVCLAFARPAIFGGVSPGLVAVAALAVPFQMVSYFSLGIHLGLERIRAYNLIDASMQGMVPVNAAITLVVLGLGITELVVANTALSVLLSVVIVGTTIGATRGDGNASEKVAMHEILSHGFRFFIAIAASLVILRGDLLIVNYFRGTEEAGVYAIATQASLLMQMVPNIVATMLFPRTSAKQDVGGELTCRVTRHATFLLVVGCLVAAPFAFVLPLVYGAAFAAVPTLFLILLPGGLLMGIETVQVQHFAGLGLPREVPAFWIITTAINIGLNMMLVPAFGAIAAAAVSTFSYALMFVLIAFLFRSRTGRSLSETFVIKSDEFAEMFRLHKIARG